MRARVEFSGCGHYGVCTIIARDDLPKFSEMLLKTPLAKDWYNPELDIWPPVGFDNALSILNKNIEDPEVKLAWNPRKMTESMRSHYLLMKIAKYGLPKSDIDLPGANLEVSTVETHNGWGVHANLSAAAWDEIEKPEFQEIVPQISRDIRNWWEDQTGHEERAQYLTVRKGKDGVVLMVYQPCGNGLWIDGCRHVPIGVGEHQFHDHNTDTAFQALGHVVSLCTVLKYCRAAINK